MEDDLQFVNLKRMSQNFQPIIDVNLFVGVAQIHCQGVESYLSVVNRNEC
jgi:hypothetical protein